MNEEGRNVFACMDYVLLVPGVYMYMVYIYIYVHVLVHVYTILVCFNFCVQAYGIADSSERSNLLATLVGSKSLEINESEMKRDRKNPEYETESEANSVSRGQHGEKQQEGVAGSGREKRRVEVKGGGPGRGGKGDGRLGKEGAQRGQEEEKKAELGEAAKSAGKRLVNSEMKMSFQRAVLTLQAGVRGYLCRKRVRAYSTRQNAATIIQATW